MVVRWVAHWGRRILVIKVFGFLAHSVLTAISQISLNTSVARSLVPCENLISILGKALVQLLEGAHSAQKKRPLRYLFWMRGIEEEIKIAIPHVRWARWQEKQALRAFFLFARGSLLLSFGFCCPPSAPPAPAPGEPFDAPPEGDTEWGAVDSIAFCWCVFSVQENPSVEKLFIARAGAQ